MRKVLQSMIDDCPVDQIVRVQDRQARRAMEAGRGEIIVSTDADDV
jgi:hypothetical protein